MTGDGNCIPRSICAGIFGKEGDDFKQIAEEKHKLIREEICNEMIKESFHKTYEMDCCDFFTLNETIINYKNYYLSDYASDLHLQNIHNKVDQILNLTKDLKSEKDSSKRQSVQEKLDVLKKQIPLDERKSLIVRLTKHDKVWFTFDHLQAASNIYNVKLFSFIFKDCILDLSNDFSNRDIMINQIICPIKKDESKDIMKTICIIQSDSHCDLLIPHNSNDLNAFEKFYNRFLNDESSNQKSESDAPENKDMVIEANKHKNIQTTNGDDANNSNNLTLEKIEKILKSNKDKNSRHKYQNICLNMLLSKKPDGSPKYKSIQWLDHRTGTFQITKRKEFCQAANELKIIDSKLNHSTLRSKFSSPTSKLICLNKPGVISDTLEYRFSQWSLLTKIESESISFDELDYILKRLSVNTGKRDYWRAIIFLMCKKCESVKLTDTKNGIFKITKRYEFVEDLKSNLDFRDVDTKNLKTLITKSGQIELVKWNLQENEYLFRFVNWSNLLKGRKLKYHNGEYVEEKMHEDNSNQVNEHVIEDSSSKIQSITKSLIDWKKNCGTQIEFLNLNIALNSISELIVKGMAYDGTCKSTCKSREGCSDLGTATKCICRLANQLDSKIFCNDGCPCKNYRCRFREDTSLEHKSNDSISDNPINKKNCEISCPFSCGKIEKDKMNDHFALTHLPFAYLICLKCTGYIKSSTKVKDMRRHLKKNHGILNPVRNDYKEMIPTPSKPENQAFLVKTATLATHLLDGLKQPVSEQLYKWATNEMTKEEKENVLKVKDFYLNRSNIPNRGKACRVEDSHTYLLVKKTELKDKISFLKSITKIGKTIISKERHLTYVALRSSHYTFKVNKGGSEDDVFYTETIITKVLNKNNLDGVAASPHYIHIDESIISIKDQNWLAIHFFDEAYNEFLNICD